VKKVVSDYEANNIPLDVIWYEKEEYIYGVYVFFCLM
jgi:hypothetical protein